MRVILYDAHHLCCHNHYLKYDQRYTGEILIKMKFTPQILCRLQHKISFTYTDKELKNMDRQSPASAFPICCTNFNSWY
jgi:hypothetical protein